jgi:hypothetical protein
VAEGKVTARSLTPAATKILDDADASLYRAHSEVRAKISTVRAEAASGHVGEGTLRCFRCSCDHFVSSSSSGGHLNCKRSGCNHSFFSHDVF